MYIKRKKKISVDGTRQNRQRLGLRCGKRGGGEGGRGGREGKRGGVRIVGGGGNQGG